jgi:hypothetical protein
MYVATTLLNISKNDSGMSLRKGYGVYPVGTNAPRIFTMASSNERPSVCKSCISCNTVDGIGEFSCTATGFPFSSSETTIIDSFNIHLLMSVLTPFLPTIFKIKFIVLIFHIIMISFILDILCRRATYMT